MRDKKLVIFDMDGTLVDSSGVIAGAINHVRSELGLTPLDRDLILSKVNDPSVNAARFFYNAKAFTPLHEQLFSQYYTSNHTKELRLYEGIKPLLERLKSTDKKLALATNAYRQSTLETIEHLKIDEFFDTVVCYDDVEEGKPHPQMLHKVLSDTEVSNERAVFVGDGPRDAIAAKRTPMDFLMVNWGFSKHPDALTDTRQLSHLLLEA